MITKKKKKKKKKENRKKKKKKEKKKKENLQNCELCCLDCPQSKIERKWKEE